MYIFSSQRNGTLYIGITSHLVRRIWEHKEKLIKGFTSEYNINKLVYYEIHENIGTAIQREKRLKEWPRKWKLKLIETMNPDWLDLYDKIV